MELRCDDRKKEKVYVISAYRVAQEKNDGIQTAYTQQYRIMREKE